QVLLDRALFLAAAAYALSQLAMGIRAQWRRKYLTPSQGPAAGRGSGQQAREPGVRSRWRLAGAALLAALVVAQPLAPLDARAAWDPGRVLLGREAPAFAAALRTAGGQGFVSMAGTPMSYAAGYAWGALLLALAIRWRLFGWHSRGGRWLTWGWLCGAAGTF